MSVRDYSLLKSGSKFGRVILLGPNKYNEEINEVMWKYKCELCGHEGWASTETLYRTPEGSNDIKVVCHKCRHIPDLRGQIFGKLTVLSLDKIDKNVGIWKCQCSCDAHNITYVPTSSLTSGNTKSCGCLQKENHFKKHGMSDSKIYGVYKSIKQRCDDPNDNQYKNYGAKKCFVCKRWLGEDGFNNFYEDMGDTYVDGYGLALKDFYKGYCPENCMWVPKSEMSNYISSARFTSISFNGVNYSPAINLCKELKDKYNIDDARTKSATYIKTRINKGWTEKQAIIIPPLGNEESKEDWLKRHGITSDDQLPDKPVKRAISFIKKFNN